MKRIWQTRKGGGEGRGQSGSRPGRDGGLGLHGQGWPSAERQSRYCKSGSLDNRYSGRQAGGLMHDPHLMGHLHLPHPWLDVAPPPQLPLGLYLSPHRRSAFKLYFQIMLPTRETAGPGPETDKGLLRTLMVSSSFVRVKYLDGQL